LPLGKIVNPGGFFSGLVTCFSTNPLDCTLLACWQLNYVEGTQPEPPQLPRDVPPPSNITPSTTSFSRSVSVFLGGLLKILADMLNGLPLVLERLSAYTFFSFAVPNSS
jgi:hypothetical protein